MHRLALLLGAAMLGLGILRAGEEPAARSKVTAVCRHRGDRAIEIDGRLDDAAWKAAEPLKGFSVLRSDGKQSAHATTARLLWDDKHFYVSFDCQSEDLRNPVAERDGPVWDGEAVETFLCPKGPDAVYYEINFNPKNVIYDSRVETWKYEEQVKHWQKWAKSFNPHIRSATRIHKDSAGKATGWSLEAAIPFADLDVIGGKAPKAGDVWFFNVFRVAALKGDNLEYSHWQPVTPEFHRPRQFPRLKFEAARPAK